MKQITICIIVLLLIIALSCNKNKNNTDTAYFSCYIDGQYFEPEKQQGLGEYPITAKLLYDETDLRISVNKGITNVFIGLLDSTFIKNTEYLLSNNSWYYSRATYDNNLSVDEYFTDSIFTGKAQIISLDKIKMTVQGSFHFDAYNPALNDTVHITNGKFKLKYTLH